MKNIKSKIIILVALLIAIAGGVFYLFNINSAEDVVEDKPEPIVEVFNDEEKELLIKWKENERINPDFTCQLVFDSGIINLPVVRGNTNTQYERTDWATMKHDEEGSIFMDYESKDDSTNITIYGHYVYPNLDPDQTHKFSPLTLLLKEENYKANKDLELVFDGEIRHYEVAYVYYCPLNLAAEGYYYTNDNAQYYLSEFTQEYFNSYMSFVKQQALYDTGVEIEYGDSLLTLQTCVLNREDLREIVVCKEISRVHE